MLESGSAAPWQHSESDDESDLDDDDSETIPHPMALDIEESFDEVECLASSVPSYPDNDIINRDPMGQPSQVRKEENEGMHDAEDTTRIFHVKRNDKVGGKRMAWNNMTILVLLAALVVEVVICYHAWYEWIAYLY